MKRSSLLNCGVCAEIHACASVAARDEAVLHQPSVVVRDLADGFGGAGELLSIWIRSGVAHRSSRLGVGHR